MKELCFAELDISDFKEFRGRHRLNLRKLGTGLHFVRGVNEVEPRLGSNGAGKSSLWDALSWCCYGRTPSGLRGTDVRSWGSKEHAEVGVRIVSDEGEQCWVRRSTKTNGLWIDDQVVDQAEIDRILGMSFETFQHTILLGQGQPLFFDLKPSEKMARLSEALALDRWEARSDAAKKKAQELEMQIAEAEGSKAELERQLKDAERQEADLEARRNAWEKEAAEAEKGRTKKLKEARSQLRLAVDQMADHDLALDRYETELRATRSSLIKKGDELIDLAAKRSAAQAALEDKKVRIEALEAHDAVTDGKCPMCKQSLKGTALEKHNAEIKRQLTAAKMDLSKLSKNYDKALDAAEAKRAEIHKETQELRDFEAKADDARDGLTRAQQTKASAESVVKQLEADKERGDAQINPYAELFTKARKQANKIAGLLEEMDALVALASRKKEWTRYWVQGFKQVRLYLLQEILDELSGVIQTLLPQIGLEGWIVELSTERESSSGKAIHNLHVDIYKPELDKKVRWESWSGGEAQRLRLVGAIALSQVLLRRAGVDCDLLILDEPTRHMSAEGVADMIDFLLDLGRDYQIFYVDHAARETKRFAGVIQVRRDAAGSHLELA